jgi:hypothetical protein
MMPGLTAPSSICEIIELKKPKPIDQNGTGAAADAADAADDMRPPLIVDNGDLPAVAARLRDIIARSNQFFDRGGPVRIAWRPKESTPTVERLNACGVVRAAHQLCRPVNIEGKPVTLPERVANLYLDMKGEWHLRPLVAITTAPILAKDGTIQTIEGYETASGVFCCQIPKLNLPENPTRADAEGSLATLRAAFKTFPFADSKRRIDSGIEVADLDQPPDYDESALIAGLLTAICRQSLRLAPGLLVTAPSISGAATGKGLVTRAIASIAYGLSPRPFPPGNDKAELDKRLVAEAIQGNPIVFLDNANGFTLRSDTLASFLTERPSQIRILGRSQMVQLELASFFVVTGNGLVLSEDLARRFISVELDARCEDPEQRSFSPGFLEDIDERRAELLAAGLTVLRWGRQNAHTIKRGRSLGSFESWGEWVRDPLVALGCRDPVDRIAQAKARDPARLLVISLFAAWHEHHGDAAMKVSELHEAVGAIADPNKRGRQFLARAIGGYAGTRLGGFVLDRLEQGNARKEGVRYRLVSAGGQNPSAPSAASARPELGANQAADGAGDADAIQSKPKALVCAHCGEGGELLEYSVSGRTVLLHRDCIDPWERDHG